MCVTVESCVLPATLHVECAIVLVYGRRNACLCCYCCCWCYIKGSLFFLLLLSVWYISFHFRLSVPLLFVISFCGLISVAFSCKFVVIIDCSLKIFISCLVLSVCLWREDDLFSFACVIAYIFSCFSCIFLWGMLFFQFV